MSKTTAMSSRPGARTANGFLFDWPGMRGRETAATKHEHLGDTARPRARARATWRAIANFNLDQSAIQCDTGGLPSSRPPPRRMSPVKVALCLWRHFFSLARYSLLRALHLQSSVWSSFACHTRDPLCRPVHLTLFCHLIQGSLSARSWRRIVPSLSTRQLRDSLSVNNARGGATSNWIWVWSTPKQVRHRLIARPMLV